jgi:hypothetical protein
MGVVLLAGVALDERGVVSKHAVAAAMGGWAALAVANVAALRQVMTTELRSSPLATSSEWWRLPLWVTVVLMVSGFVAWAFAGPLGHRAPARPRGSASVSP